MRVRHRNPGSRRETSNAAGQPGPHARPRNQGRVLVAAVVGEPHSGKTSTVELLARHLSGVAWIGGVLQPSLPGGDFPAGYSIRDLATGQERSFATRKQGPGRGGLGFDFEPGAWDWARERILDSRRRLPVLVVDELGRLEASGSGHVRALLVPLRGAAERLWVLSVRLEFSGEIQELLGPFHRVLAPRAPHGQVLAFAQLLAREAGLLPSSTQE